MPCRAYVSLAAGLVYLQVELALDEKHPMRCAKVAIPKSRNRRTVRLPPRRDWLKGP